MRLHIRTPLIVASMVLLTFACASAVEITVSTDPPYEAANLAQNPGVEEGADGDPAIWNLSTAVPANFTVGRAEEGEGRNGTRALHMIAHDDVMSGYWYQSVPVEPGDYVFRGWYRTTGGRMLMYAHGRNTEIVPPVGVDARAFHGSSIASFLVPVFIPHEALTGPDPDTYYPFSVLATVPEGLEQITLSMGMYFTPGEAWFDDIWFGPAELDLTVRVTGEGQQIASLTVLREGVEAPVYRSADDPACPAGQPLPDPFEVTIEGVDMRGTYTIVAETTAGEEHRVLFPGEAQ
ncbi:MAG: hypothetical protein GX131_08580 [candidate division WS1 bacterium]|nr:hypothetical protein [candidate division WS1 bacterium]